MDAAVYLGVDIGKSGHYAVAVDNTGKPIYQTGVSNDEPAVRKLVDWVKQRGAVVVVDQSTGAAALLLKLCWAGDVRIGYLHGLAMARARDFYAGASKTDPKDAFVLADVAPAHAPHGSGAGDAKQQHLAEEAEHRNLGGFAFGITAGRHGPKGAEPSMQRLHDPIVENIEGGRGVHLLANDDADETRHFRRGQNEVGDGEERLGERPTRLDGRKPCSARIGKVLAQALSHPIGNVLKTGAIELVFSAKMVGDAGYVGSRGRGDPTYRGGVEPTMAKALYCRSQQLAAGVGSIFLGLSAHATSIIKRLILSTVTLSRKAAKVKPGLAR